MYIFSLTKPNVSKICKFQVEKSLLSVFLPMLRFGISPKNFHKVNGNFDFSVEKAKCAASHISGQCTAYCLLKGGTGACKGHSDISPSEHRVFDRCKETSSPAMPFLGMEINSLDMTLTLPKEKKEKIVQQCQNLQEKVISFHKRTKSINNCSSCITAIVVLSAPLQY